LRKLILHGIVDELISTKNVYLVLF